MGLKSLKCPPNVVQNSYVFLSLVWFDIFCDEEQDYYIVAIIQHINNKQWKNIQHRY